VEHSTTSPNTASTSLLELTGSHSAVALSAQSEGSSSELTLVVVSEQSSTEQTDCECVTGQEPGCSFRRVFATTFFTIFLAELGDKTQVSTLLMSAEFHKPWVVFLGAGMALVATTLIGVWVGQWLSSRLSPRTLDIAAGILLALISASLIWEVVQPLVR